MRSQVEDPRRTELRRHPRVQVAWPVLVDDGSRLYHLHTANLSAFGAKVRSDKRLEEGIRAKLLFQPPDASPVGIEAIVWRNDPDGAAFFFLKPAPEGLIRSARSALSAAR